MTAERPPSLVTLPATATAADIKRVSDRDGGVIVKGVLTEDQLFRINAELDPLLEAQDPTGGYSDVEERAWFYGRKTRRLQSVAARSDTILDPMIDPRLLDWVGANLTWATEFQYSSAQVIDIGPGQPAQVLHRDEDLWTQLVATAPGEFTVSCMLALSDFTEELGATRVVPGTRRNLSGNEPVYTADDTAPAVMSAGDALFFTGSVVHGGGANVTDSGRRRGLALSFILGWVRPEEAMNLAVSVERARQLPPRLRELLGFAAYRAELGDLQQVEMADPYISLFGEPRPARPTVPVS